MTQDYARQFSYIADSTDAAKLAQIADNARKQGVPAIAEAAERRIVELMCRISGGLDPLAQDFWRMVITFERLEGQARGKPGFRLSRTRQKVARVGVVAILSDWATGKATEGFAMALKLGRPELTGEAIILDHAASFPDHVVAAARSRLEATVPRP